ncbi:MAG: hypothetical protein N3G20_06110, partial [Verrucomicrobiae bacterium]|nr:hypothetical protein [Verrucomicrobiae bacterium]
MADVIAIPDCEWLPEQVVGLIPGVAETNQFPRRFAEAGCRVLVPALVDRGNRFSGNPGVRQAKQSQREILWRAGYELGRALLGYELQRIIAAANWLESTRSGNPVFGVESPALIAGRSQGSRSGRIGIIGYGEGGLLALLAGAVDERFDPVGVCGAFGLLSRLPEHPIDHNIWRFLQKFGDAELCAMILPRTVCVEFGCYPEVVLTDQNGGAPGALWRPSRAEFDLEIERVLRWAPDASVHAFYSSEHVICSAEMSRAFMKSLCPTVNLGGKLGPAPAWASGAGRADPWSRVLRQYREVLEDTQHLMRESEYARKQFWSRADFSSVDSFVRSAEQYRDIFRSNVVGILPGRRVDPNPRSRQMFETETCHGYEVMLDVTDDVFAYGILVVPRGIRPGERRPAIVCQHGLEGRPSDVSVPTIDHRAYHSFG